MGVERIEPSNYKQGLLRIRHVTCAVLVFHPQCGHCIEMLPKWEAMKPMVNPRVKIVEVNGSAMHSSREMSNSPVGRGTEGFPSLLLFKKGRLVSKYDGERSPEKLADFVNQAVDPPLKRQKTQAKPARSKARPKAKGKTKKLRRKN